MVSKICLCLLCLGTSMLLIAQEDTVYLNAVTVMDTLDLAVKTTVTDSLSLAIHQGASLGDLLQASSGMYLRTYGAEGQLASVSFRGTSSSQTQVSWKGVDINSQTLGQSDFSSIPAFLFQSVDIHHGVSGSLYGSGAVGGVVELNTELIPERVGAEIVQQVGSFGKRMTGLKFQHNPGRWGMGMRAVHSKVDNDFEVNFRGDTYHQNNASSELNAIIGEGFFRIGNSRLAGSVWYNVHDREVQPVVGFLEGQDHLVDRNLRVNVSLESALNSGLALLRASYIDDRQLYNQGSKTNMKRFLLCGEYQHNFFGYLNTRAGGHLSLAAPEVTSYESDISQIGWDVYLLNQAALSDKLTLNANLRLPYQEYQERVPVIPAVGLRYHLVARGELDLHAAIRGARSYRFPTFNDLYWNPGGNKDLRPEDGGMLETSWRISANGKIISWHSEWTFYRSMITQMIVWQPSGSYWSPRNVESVKVYGVEADVQLSCVLGALWTGQLSGNYAYNNSQNQETHTQLAYVPYHKASIIAAITHKQYRVTYQEAMVGKRYTESTNTSSMEAYSVASVHLHYRWPIANHVLAVGVGIKNFWDREYFNYELRATPGRHYTIQLNYQFNQNI